MGRGERRKKGTREVWMVRLIVAARSRLKFADLTAIAAASLFLQFDDRRAATTLVLRSGVMLFHLRMRLQKCADALTQLSGAMPVNNAHFVEIGDERIVEEARQAIDGLIDRHPDHVQLAQHPFTRLEVNVDPHLRLGTLL